MPGSDPVFSLAQQNTVSSDEQELTEVVKRAQEGDEAAFDRLFQTYNIRICTYLLRMVGNEEEAHDLAQETFLKAWRALSQATHADELRFDSWLYRIATRTAIDYLRGSQFRWLRRIQQVVETNPAARLPGPEDRIAEMEHITQALAQVTPKYRACLLLQIEVGFSQKEIAQLLGSNEKSVSVYVSRGREQFRRAYLHLAGNQASHGREQQ